MKKVYYESFSDELVKNSNQDYKLKDNFKWIHTNIFYIFISYIVYLFFVLVGFIYLKVYYRIKFVNKKIIKKYKKYYIYSNHVLEIGDPFIPLVSNFPRRSFTLVNPANLGVPVIGKLIPMVGGIPIPDNVHDIVKMRDGMKYHLDNNRCIVVFPEAHVWPYCNFIREFPKTSFRFPIEDEVPTFVYTTTFKKTKFRKIPKVIVNISGPFYGVGNTNKEKITSLHDQVFKEMKKNSINSYEFIKYIKK